MKRRQMIFRTLQAASAATLRWTVPTALTGSVCQAWSASVESAPRALPSADQVAWQDLEMGMFVHFAPNTWQDVESDNLSTPLSQIDPKKLDTDQWAKTALALRAADILFDAKHQGCLCMWQTDT